MGRYTVKTAIHKHPFLSFVAIAFGWTWPLALLTERSIIFGLLALFGPCMAAFVVLSATRGRTVLAESAAKFRLSWGLVPWCLLSALLPLLLLVPTWFLYSWWWGFIRFEVSPLSPLSFVLAVFIVGEEVGWRGFLLPYLLQRYSPLVSSLMVGVTWALWHLPNFFLVGFPHYGLPFLAFAGMTTAFSVLFTWFYLRTKGSLVIAVVFHAALNLFSLTRLQPSHHYWAKAAVYMAVALVAGYRLYRGRSSS